ncbi:MAG: hypothetical protein Q8O40_06515 [Chloroflexota bacterium]|nr:hypothetical protein [Chloroflexota bacterium]
MCACSDTHVYARSHAYRDSHAGADTYAHIRSDADPCADYWLRSRAHRQRHATAHAAGVRPAGVAG